MHTSPDINLIDFNISVGRKKPRTINGESCKCPFCDVAHLTNIIATKDDMILLKNKYNVLNPSDQLVLIESNLCHADIPDYTPEKMHDLLRFGLTHWLKMHESGLYDEVIFFKNHGPLSGGTIQHPHMQIVAFPNIKPELMFDPSEFQGIVVTDNDDVEVNLCTKPRIGFWEINLLLNKKITAKDLTSANYHQTPAASAVQSYSHYIQQTVRFINHFFQRENLSYNIFFYLYEGYIKAKIMPRFATSPLYIGYNIHLLPTNTVEMADMLRNFFHGEK